MAEFATFTTQRKISDFTAQVTVREDHTDDLTVTDQPVEQGAQISDHAFKVPARLTLLVGWSDSSDQSQGDDYTRAIYARLLALQLTREPFSVTTGKREYENMLITSLGTTTTEDTEHALIATIGLREINIVQTQTTTVPPRENQADPEKTADTTNAGTKQAVPAQSANAKSLLQIGAEGLGG